MSVPVRVFVVVALAVVLSGCSSAPTTSAPTDDGASTTTTTTNADDGASTTTTAAEPLVGLEPCALLDGGVLAGPLGLGDGWVEVPQSAEECHWYRPTGRLTLIVLARPAADRDLDALAAATDEAFSVEPVDVAPGALAVRDTASAALLEVWVPVRGGALGVFQSVAALDDAEVLAVAATVVDRLPAGALAPPG